MHERFSTGLANLDASLGGGLLPGTLTMVIGATGVGKTQLAMAFRAAGAQQEGQPGAIIDLSSRGDSQNHSGYGQRMFGQLLTVADPARDQPPDPFRDGRPEDLLPFLGYAGRRVLRSQMDVGQRPTRTEGEALHPGIRRRTSPVDAPSSYPLTMRVRETSLRASRRFDSTSEPRPPVKTTTLSTEDYGART
mgnify:CR=1 FL=1